MKLYIISIASILAISLGCSSKQTEKHSDDNELDNKAHADKIILPTNQAKAIGLEIVDVKPDKFNQVIKTSGQILSAQGDEVSISSTASGIVSFNKASLNDGSSVSKGETLLSISSRNIVDGDPVAKSRATYNAANEEYQRAESLIKDQLISQREYNNIKLNYENSKIAYQSVGQKTTTKGVSITTPINGYIKAKMVTEGQYVEIGQPLLTVTQNQKLQLRADISERFYKDLPNISSANFKTSYNNTVYTLSEMDGKLISYGRGTKNDDFLIPIIFEFQNLGNVLPGSYVDIFLLGQTHDNTISIPISSLTEEQGLYYVYLKLDTDTYQKQEVKIGSDNGIKVEILSGLKSGDKVVSKGAHHLKLTSTSSNIPDGHEH